MADRNIRDCPPTVVGPSAVIQDALFYSGCTIQGTVINSVLFPGVIVEQGAVVKDSILFFDTVIKKGAQVIRTITDIEAIVGARARVGDDPHGALSVVGTRTSIPDETIIHQGATVHPNLKSDRFFKSEYAAGEVVK
jgi:glucose-1-phosphate adenylyltransferase